MALPNISELTECPKCGSAEGYERTYSVKGTMTDLMNFDGSYAEEQSSQPFDCISEKSVYKFIRCLDCKKVIAKNDRL